VIQARRYEMETVKEWVANLAVKSESTDQDSRMMTCLLKRIGYPFGRCVCGIVYLEGHGTLENPPVSIHAFAKLLLEIDKNNSTRVNTAENR
jgi:hypothetical protein